MKNRASGFLKHVIEGLSSMAKSKTLAIKSKTNAIKARLIIFSLVMNKRYVMSSISHKFQSVIGNHHHSHPNEECLLGQGRENNKSIKVFNDNNAQSSEAVINPSETQVVLEDKDDKGGYESYYNYGEHDDDCVGDGNYSDLTHTMFDSEDLDLGGSVIDLVKNSKEEAGQEFKVEDDIDLIADLFIKKFRRQILLQKQESLKRYNDMLLREDA
ncbi:uncharacterized protein LOC133292241 [Gastrolobium bilobum]|uniref:uncharacterized protein LOC133292241 n=1 Tax=Gastrolobium bilobum TaxID=150636 RepID=UPI002AB2F7BF|nr:uncharacterized protein LOC133292241 [Gastrolobium bilobum]